MAYESYIDSERLGMFGLRLKGTIELRGATEVSQYPSTVHHIYVTQLRFSLTETPTIGCWDNMRVHLAILQVSPYSIAQHLSVPSSGDASIEARPSLQAAHPSSSDYPEILLHSSTRLEATR